MSAAEKTWPCMSCGEPIRVRPDATLGTARYEHVDPVILSSHFPARPPRVEAQR